EREVPRRKPWIFPLVRHRDNVPVEKMRPFSIPTEVTLRRWRWLRRITRQPFANRVMIKLFAPKQAGVSLARNFFGVPIHLRRNDSVVKLVRFLHALAKDLVEVDERCSRER